MFGTIRKYGLLRDFIVNKLKLAQNIVDDIQFERVHKMGNFYPNSRTVGPCDVNAKVCMTLIVSCMNNSPPEISARRHAHMPAMKATKRQGKRAWLSYDRLYIDGKPVYTDQQLGGPEGAGTGKRDEVDEHDHGEQVELRHALNDNTSRKIEKRVLPKPPPRRSTRERQQPERYGRYEDFVMNAAQAVARPIDN
ncbi:hypothetical protein MAR_025498 [Mya arenaria]|uniref:Uncharacterized protein n=1 Tax=Mya arenaria TaxID=6604 RepID=A0ABY7ERY7_MYAAR|nr:hypothetical protein MAR_025498 [Mya arenaria]